MSILKTVKLYTVNGQTVWLHKLYFYTSMNLKNVLIPGPNPSQLGMKLMMKPAAMNVPPCAWSTHRREIYQETGAWQINSPSVWAVGMSQDLRQDLLHCPSMWDHRTSSLQCKPILNSSMEPSSPLTPSHLILPCLKWVSTAFSAYCHTVLTLWVSHTSVSTMVAFCITLSLLLRHQGELMHGGTEKWLQHSW